MLEEGQEGAAMDFLFPRANWKSGTVPILASSLIYLRHQQSPLYRLYSRYLPTSLPTVRSVVCTYQPAYPPISPKYLGIYSYLLYIKGT